MRNSGGGWRTEVGERGVDRREDLGQIVVHDLSLPYRQRHLLRLCAGEAGRPPARYTGSHTPPGSSWAGFSMLAHSRVTQEAPRSGSDPRRRSAIRPAKSTAVRALGFLA